MRALSAAEFLNVWERGLLQPPVERALTLLSAASSEDSWESLKRLHVGARDARLLALREETFGTELSCIATCPQCLERLEMSLSTADLHLETAAAGSENFELAVDGYEFCVRLPDSLDLEAVSNTGDVNDGLRLLLKRCVPNAVHEGKAVSIEELPDEVIDAIADRMGQLDPQGDVRLSLICPLCRHEWTGIFDIEPFLWKEITAWAHRVLREVHTLASAYGWSERDVLSMTGQRRQAYLELVSA
jgi:hypothetical protein